MTATIILVAICIVAGLVIYSLSTSASSTLFARGQITVEAVDLVKQTDGATAFAITVKNTGNRPAVWLTAELQGQSEQTLEVADDYVSEFNPLQPGQYACFIAEAVEPSNYYRVGETYRVVIRARFSDGSLFVKTEAVTCRSSG